MASGCSACTSRPRIPASSIDGSARTLQATLRGPNSPGSPTPPTLRPVGGLPGGGVPTTRRSFLLGAGAVEGVLAVGCSKTDPPPGRSAAGGGGTTTTAPATAGSKYLSGPYAPVSEELTLPDLKVT